MKATVPDVPKILTFSFRLRGSPYPTPGETESAGGWFLDETFQANRSNRQFLCCTAEGAVPCRYLLISPVRYNKQGSSLLLEVSCPFFFPFFFLYRRTYAPESCDTYDPRGMRTAGQGPNHVTLVYSSAVGAFGLSLWPEREREQPALYTKRFIK